jgi:FAD/FMN-containing dehydrogenase/Fe-S oxidoreductase
MLRRIDRSSLPGRSFDALARELSSALKGEVRFDEGSRALYATDGSNYRQVPIGVVAPRDEEDLLRGLEICRRFEAPVLARGGGTSLAGQCCNAAVVFDFTKFMHRIIELHPDRRTAWVQPGLILDELRGEAEKSHLTFAPDPSTHTHCTLGGMIGNNSCGVHSVMGGKTSDNTEELDIVTYDGLRLRVGATSEEDFAAIQREGGRRAEIYRSLRALAARYGDLIRRRFPNIPRRVSGYNLVDLLPENGFHVAKALVGSEGTCVTVLRARVRLLPSPPRRTLVVLGFPDVFAAADRVPDVLRFGPIGLEGMDQTLLEDMRLKGMPLPVRQVLPDGEGWLLAEFGGATREESDARAKKMIEALHSSEHPPTVQLFDDADDEKKVWKIRESGLAATARVPNQKDTWEGWEDSAVPPDRLGHYLREFRKLLSEHGYHGALYGHFGQGCLHTRIDFELTSADGIAKYRRFIHEAADLVLSLGGSLSGEHGDGQSRAELLPKMFGPELIQAFREFKTIWDPDGRMNPGKVVDAYAATENLRLGTDYAPPTVTTAFQYPKDSGSFARATLRCVGVGACRRMDSGVMCPSYRVTREEMHSTRGRAHLLFEMLRGGLSGGWKDPHVRGALDLCLACKGCKSDCPMNVDMATYKAEFLHHYYRRRLRPRSAYAMGLVYWWARAASHFPRLANFFTHSRLFASLAKIAAGVAPERTIPSLAPQPFTAWWRTRGPQPARERRVLLWPDTFTNYFEPGIARAAVRALEAAGISVAIPEAPLCCGRPLYDYGMLDLARRLLVGILDALRDEIRRGTPVVGLEPSCVAVFRDELGNLLPHDEDARRLAGQCFALGEFLATHVEGYRPPTLHRKALVQTHCHHHAVIGFESQATLLRTMGLDVTIPDSGCCGMAGSFGFEADHYDVSQRCGERVLFPAVRAAEPETLIVADGFSCRHQIEQATGRRALHLAELLEMALDEEIRARDRAA